MATRLERLHEDNYFVWTDDQAQALRRLARIIEHALKLEHSSSSDPRHGWHATIADARRELEFRLTPSLRRDLATNLARLYVSSRRRAARSLERYGEHDAATSLPETCPYTLDQLLDED